MANVVAFLEALALAAVDAAAILLFLLLGIVCVALLERKAAASLEHAAAPHIANVPELLHRLKSAIEAYARGLLTENRGRFLPWLASVASVACGIVAFAALSFGPAIHLADLSIGLLFVVAASFLGTCGAALTRAFSIGSRSLAGVARNAMRVASYEGAAALALISGVALAGSLSMKQIVEAQREQGAWFFFLAPVGFLLYLAASLAGTDAAVTPTLRRAAEPANDGEAGAEKFHWPLGSLRASIHLLIVAGLATTVFWGGWLRPFASYHDHFSGTTAELLDALPPLTALGIAAYCLRVATRERDDGRKLLMKIAGGVGAVLFAILAGVLFFSPAAVAAVHGAFWFLAKMVAYIYVFLWLRLRIPHLRFGRPIRAAWNFLIPLGVINAVGVAAALVAREQWNWSPASSTIALTALVLGAAVWLGLHDPGESAALNLDA